MKFDYQKAVKKRNMESLLNYIDKCTDIEDLNDLPEELIERVHARELGVPYFDR